MDPLGNPTLLADKSTKRKDVMSHNVTLPETNTAPENGWLEY